MTFLLGSYKPKVQNGRYRTLLNLAVAWEEAISNTFNSYRTFFQCAVLVFFLNDRRLRRNLAGSRVLGGDPLDTFLKSGFFVPGSLFSDLKGAATLFAAGFLAAAGWTFFFMVSIFFKGWGGRILSLLISSL